MPSIPLHYLHLYPFMSSCYTISIWYFQNIYSHCLTIFVWSLWFGWLQVTDWRLLEDAGLFSATVDTQVTLDWETERPACAGHHTGHPACGPRSPLSLFFSARCLVHLCSEPWSRCSKYSPLIMLQKKYMRKEIFWGFVWRFIKGCDWSHIHFFYWRTIDCLCVCLWARRYSLIDANHVCGHVVTTHSRVRSGLRGNASTEKSKACKLCVGTMPLEEYVWAASLSVERVLVLAWWLILTARNNESFRQIFAPGDWTWRHGQITWQVK